MKSNSFLNSVFVISLRLNTPAGKSQLYRNTDRGQIQTDLRKLHQPSLIHRRASIVIIIIISVRKIHPFPDSWSDI